MDSEFVPTTLAQPTQVSAVTAEEKPPELGRWLVEEFQRPPEAAREWTFEWVGITHSRERTQLWQEGPSGVEFVGAWRESGYEWTSTRGVREELTERKRRVEALEGELLFQEQAARFAAASVASSELGLFMLHKIGQAEDGLLVDDVAANLEGPQGWLAIARLMKAGLVDENGLSFYLTPEGEQALSERSTS